MRIQSAICPKGVLIQILCWERLPLKGHLIRECHDGIYELYFYLTLESLKVNSQAKDIQLRNVYEPGSIVVTPLSHSFVFCGKGSGSSPARGPCFFSSGSP